MQDRVALQRRVTQHELGIRLGYGEHVARKAVRQLLWSKDPRTGMLRRFATAAEMPLDELVNGPKAGKRKK